MEPVRIGTVWSRLWNGLADNLLRLVVVVILVFGIPVILILLLIALSKMGPGD